MPPAITDEGTRDAVFRWLAGHDRGASSECIAFTALGVHCEPRHPLDPADLGRCLRLLARVPVLQAGFAERMRGVSLPWALLVAAWDELAALMEEEVGIAWSKGGTAPRTYARMRELGVGL